MLDADTIIVGAGLAGAATAYELRRLGDRRIVILERETVPGAHSSGRNAAMLRSQVADPLIQPLVDAGARVLRRGALAPYRPVGSVLIGGGGDFDVSGLVPPARGRGLYTPADGIIDVAALLQAYLRDQDVRFETELRSWRPTPGGVQVDTSRGALTARVLVNAAGPWAGRLGNLPLTPLLRHLFVTAPADAVDRRWPFVWDVEHGLYFRPESGGLLLCPCDEAITEPGDYTERWEVMAELVDKVDRLQPGLRSITRDLTIQHRWAGQRTFAPDRRFVIGFDHREPALFWVAGLGGHGVTCSPAIGRLAAKLLRQGPGAASPFGTERLGSEVGTSGRAL